MMYILNGLMFGLYREKAFVMVITEIQRDLLGEVIYTPKSKDLQRQGECTVWV